VEHSTGFTLDGTSEQADFEEGSALLCACFPEWEGSTLLAGGWLLQLPTATGSNLY
jgi:hypothetical protein